MAESDEEKFGGLHYFQSLFERHAVRVTHQRSPACPPRWGLCRDCADSKCESNGRDHFRGHRSAEGGFTARALGEAIFTEADDETSRADIIERLFG